MYLLGDGHGELSPDAQHSSKAVRMSSCLSITLISIPRWYPRGESNGSITDYGATGGERHSVYCDIISYYWISFTGMIIRGQYCIIYSDT